MQIDQAEGIVLQTFDFRDYDQIATVFTKERGIIKLIAKNANRAKNSLKNSVPIKAEFVYAIGKSEICTLKEIFPKEYYLNLRQNYSCLNTAFECLKCILKTQMAEKPAPFLYELLQAYLSKLPKLKNYEAASCSFYLKVLQHEGVLNLNPEELSKEEIFLMKELAKAASFSHLETLEVPKDFKIRLENLRLLT
ncbi:MAG TPA: DNA repair protein RecO [Parachlamydiaceae bacterium]|nr:DNA repair protein RecO [Parachlamydiaceae bacterium]